MSSLKMNWMNRQRNFKAISTKGLTKDLTNGYKILKGARYFSSWTLPNHLIYFLDFLLTQVLSWKSIGISEESIENITTSGSNFAPS